MLVVGRLNPLDLGEVQTAHDADPIGHVAVHLGQFRVAGGRHERRVEFLVALGHQPAVEFSIGLGHQPEGLQCIEPAAVDPIQRGLAQPQHRGGLEHDAQVVQVLEHLEVERADLPAGSKVHLHEAFALQPEQRLADRRARDAQAGGDLGLGEAVAGHQAELGDIVLHFVVDGVCERGMQW